MKVAFVTTMKAPDAKAPSGDRTFARLLRTAIGLAGHEVFGASGFSTWRADPQETATMEPNAIAAAERLVDLLHTDGAPDAVLTYHNYHKGPDLIGPRISRAFDIPYAIVEASRAQKRADGPWARGFFLADEALQAAHALGVVTRRDRPALEAFAPEAIVPFPPFVDTTPFQRLSTGDGHHVVCAGMMRPGRKAESFRILADVFRIIRAERPDTRFTVAGDGEARGELEPLFPPGTFTGLLAQDQLAHLFSRSDIFVWPAIDEPFGFVFLEAQAAGLPVVGGAARGVFDVVQDGKTGLLAEPTDAPALARATLSLLSDQDQRRAMASAARSFAGENDLQAGAARLGALLTHAARRHGKAP